MKEEKASCELNLNELFLSVAHFTLSPTAANAENLCLRQQTSEWVGKNCRHFWYRKRFLEKINTDAELLNMHTLQQGYYVK